ncbi:MAG: AAA family ATPase [Bacteroides sp.]|nr:AAA family ATPase [Bacillota bacterium]MCM1394230.1 AAA family ATPase [[Eubacterium] siraeum]MCM1455987.1 AAA family ATPase [Bacteroides sp.]
MKNIKTEIPKLDTAFWNFFALEQEDLIRDYTSKSQNIAKAIQNLTSKIGELGNKISCIDARIIFENQNVTSVQPTIDKINHSLRTYGFDGFTIVPSTENQNCYMIKRSDGTLVKSTLSEGEATFITFLYFVQMCEGALNTDDIHKNKIIILDDPTSSLDSTVLFIVSTIIKDLKNKIIHNSSAIKQLFVMTHNIYFHKEISFDYKHYKDNVHFWILRKIGNVSYINDCNNNNPIKTSYQLLWDQIKENNSLSCVVVKNCMRRILESYFSFVGDEWQDKIIDKFDTVEEKIIAQSLISWINEGSHDVPDDIDIDPYGDIGLYKKVFREIFIKTNNEEHYKMMGENN